MRLGVGTTVEEAEKLLILKTLEATSNNKTRAAEILGISLKTLHNKLKEYGNAAADAALDERREEQSNWHWALGQFYGWCLKYQIAKC